MADLVYAFLDESPSLNSPDLFFCVAIILTDLSIQKSLAKILKKARARITKPPSELKFNSSSEKIRSFVLEQLSRSKVSIVVLIIDKKHRRVIDSPANYGLAVGAAISQCLTLYPHLSLTADRHYTNPRQYSDFLASTHAAIHTFDPKTKEVLFNPPADSQTHPLIQLADFIAGAFNSKYNLKNPTYTEIIKNVIVKETVASWIQLKRAATPGL